MQVIEMEESRGGGQRTHGDISRHGEVTERRIFRTEREELHWKEMSIIMQVLGEYR